MNAKFWAAILLAASLVSGAVFAADDSSQDEVEAQLKAARQKLEDAAHEVAELSTRLGKPLVDRLMLMGEGPGHAVIGVQLDAKDSKDGAHVRGVSPGGPAAEAGIRAGDVIVSVNGTDVKVEHPSAEVARLMRSVEPNSKVKIHVLRDGKPADFEVTARPVENAWDMPGMPPRPGMPFDGFAAWLPGRHARLSGGDGACDTDAATGYVLWNRQRRARAARTAQRCLRPAGRRCHSINRWPRADERLPRDTHSGVLPSRGEGQTAAHAPAQENEFGSPGP